MITYTLADAIKRAMKDHPTARFLTLEEAVKDKNVLCLHRRTDIRNKPYVSTWATIVGTTRAGKVRVMLYATGTATKLVDLQTIFTLDNEWCRHEPTVSHLYCSGHLEGTIYWQRHRYFKLYDKSLTTEEVERLTLLDWQKDPESFTRAKEV